MVPDRYSFHDTQHYYVQQAGRYNIYHNSGEHCSSWLSSHKVQEWFLIRKCTWVMLVSVVERLMLDEAFDTLDSYDNTLREKPLLVHA